jgi:thiol:disulfide interchange protein
METFKQVMGFVLLGTVVFILSFLPPPMVVPAVGLLFAIWAGCWWIGRIPLTAETAARARGWLEAAVIIAAAWLILFPALSQIFGSFGSVYEAMSSRYRDDILHSGEKLLEQRMEKEGLVLVKGEESVAPRTGPHTVMVDFTANWCVNCKAMEATVLNTNEVRQLVDQNKVITLKADWTEDDPEVTRFLNLLSAPGVPVIAIFPARDPNNPIIFRTVTTQGPLLEALRKAGPSR